MTAQGRGIVGAFFLSLLMWVAGFAIVDLWSWQTLAEVTACVVLVGLSVFDLSEGRWVLPFLLVVWIALEIF